MKGLTLLFLATFFGLIGWGYCDKESRKWATTVVRKNLLAFLAAALVLAVAIAVSTNTTLRLV